MHVFPTPDPPILDSLSIMGNMFPIMDKMSGMGGSGMRGSGVRGSGVRGLCVRGLCGTNWLFVIWGLVCIGRPV